MNNKVKKYSNIDGIRTIVAIELICMHVKANVGYKFPHQGGILAFLINNFIVVAGNLVPLFFVISGFVMCSGYYDKIKNNQISLDQFYSKRYSKIFPFFAVLVFLDLFINIILTRGIDLNNIYEGMADLTLAFGLFPVSNISVIGVGWTLGVIFGFYMLFPFFVFLVWNKKRAWFSFVVSGMVYYLCKVYFVTDSGPVSANTISWMCYFLLGAIIFLYGDKINTLFYRLNGKKGKIIGSVLVLCGWLIVHKEDVSLSESLTPVFMLLRNTLGYSMMIVGAMAQENIILSNTVTRFVSKVSLELYIGHMFIYRIIEKIGITAILGENMWSYIFTCIFTIVGTLVFAVGYQRIETFVRNTLFSRK